MMPLSSSWIPLAWILALNGMIGPAHPYNIVLTGFLLMDDGR
jgi:hypothetical protein